MKWRVGLDIGVEGEYVCSDMTLSDASFAQPSGVDEVVVGSWFHLEAMSDEDWFLRVGARQFSINTKGAVEMVEVDAL